MAEKRMWNKREKEVLISAVQKQPVLYDKGPDYRNKDMRYDAWSQVLQEVLIVRPDTSLYEIRSQWRVLQTCAARSERKRKIKEATMGQVGCNPKTWLEQALAFCRDEQNLSQLMSYENGTSCTSPYSGDGFDYDENVEGEGNVIRYDGGYSSATIIPHIEETETNSRPPHGNSVGNASVWIPQEDETVNDALEEAAVAAENQNSRTQEIQDGLHLLLTKELQRSSGVWAGTGTFVSDVLQRLSPQDALSAWKEINSVLEKYLPLMREDNL